MDSHPHSHLKIGFMTLRILNAFTYATKTKEENIPIRTETDYADPYLLFQFKSQLYSSHVL